MLVTDSERSGPLKPREAGTYSNMNIAVNSQPAQLQGPDLQNLTIKVTSYYKALEKYCINKLSIK